MVYVSNCTYAFDSGFDSNTAVVMLELSWAVVVIVGRTPGRWQCRLHNLDDPRERIRDRDHCNTTIEIYLVWSPSDSKDAFSPADTGVNDIIKRNTSVDSSRPLTTTQSVDHRRRMCEYRRGDPFDLTRRPGVVWRRNSRALPRLQRTSVALSWTWRSRWLLLTSEAVTGPGDVIIGVIVARCHCVESAYYTKCILFVL